MKTVSIADARSILLGLTLGNLHGILPGAEPMIDQLGKAVADAEAAGTDEIEVGVMEGLWAIYDATKSKLQASIAQAESEGR